MKAYLALEDGTVFEGTSFGSEGERLGEVVFNTSITGYQEILTDPSYKGQIVTMTYPQIGNYGVNKNDFESDVPRVEGFVVRECSRIYSNWRGEGTLQDFLIKYNIPAITGIDTRALTRRIRLSGAMKGVISTIPQNPKSLVEKARASPSIVGRDLVKEVTCKEPYKWNHESRTTNHELKYKVVVMDFGIKRDLLRSLAKVRCEVTAVPAHTKSHEILEMNPDGVFLSNGPGDPKALSDVIREVKRLIGKLPIFGVCLGHQILGLALGGDTFKLKFGHRGGNQPVRNEENGRVEITTQNHGFCVDPTSLPKDVILTHRNLNDNTLEGIRHKTLPIFSVQYHPEASPGPHDTQYLFHQFTRLMESGKA
ncbi:MAG: glutamine-hydrolyzing carbamoyl-phosphate synthase small subunit [bacterium]|nr:glutamine-hydrolyzing carbamoyl-phosphate synthase small subunit [bacterium]